MQTSEFHFVIMGQMTYFDHVKSMASIFQNKSVTLLFDPSCASDTAESKPGQENDFDLKTLEDDLSFSYNFVK